jgi:hypothetical protein
MAIPRGIIVAFLVFFITSARPAEYSFQYDSNNKISIIISGDFSEDEITRFASWMQTVLPAESKKLLSNDYSNIKTLVYISPGGNVVAGMAFGLFARGLGLATSVPDNAYCVSACALAWSGGIKRYAGRGARIGYHQVFVLRGHRKLPDLGVTKQVADILLNWGIPNHILHGLLTFGPDQVFWLTSDDYDAMGVILSKSDTLGKNAPAANICNGIGTNNKVTTLPDIIRNATPSLREMLEVQIFYRCVDDVTYICIPRGGFECDQFTADKLSKYEMPNDYIVEFCKENNNDYPPMVITGHETIFTWRCLNGKPIIENAQKLDEYGFRAESWTKLGEPLPQ